MGARDYRRGGRWFEGVFLVPLKPAPQQKDDEKDRAS